MNMPDTLSLSELLTYATQEEIKKSTYLIAGRACVRLFNSKEWLATIPALLPNIPKVKKLFIYSNIGILRPDYKNSIPTKNRKTDLTLVDPINELADVLGITFEDLANKAI